MKLYNIFIPVKGRIPVIASLPHSGTHVPRSVQSQFINNPEPVLYNMDWHLEKLYDFLPEIGIMVIQATHSRYVVNLNRDLNPPLFGPERSSVIPAENAWGSPLYNSEISQEEAERRIKKYCAPYHRRLIRMLKNAARDFQRVYLLDLHSYGAEWPQADVCLGDVNGTSCSGRLTACFERAVSSQGFSVTRNERWTGGHITRHYGSMDNIEALQIEIRFSAYLPGREFPEKEIKAWDSVKFSDARERLIKAFGSAVKELLDEGAV